jgi:hypothetical protein
MAGERDDRGYRFHIRLVMVSDDRFGRDVRPGQGLTKKGFRTRSITFVAQQYINDLSLRINRTV